MYSVVFEYTGGEMAGNRYRSSWPSKEEFDARQTHTLDQGVEVVAEGVSDEEGLRLCEEVRPFTMLAGAIAMSRSGDSVDQGLLAMHMGNVRLALEDRRKKLEKQLAREGGM